MKDFNFFTIFNLTTKVTIDCVDFHYVVFVFRRTSYKKRWRLCDKYLFSSSSDAEKFVFDNYGYLIIPFPLIQKVGTSLQVIPF